MVKSSQEIEVNRLFEPTANKPVLVCGLPGSGYVGKLAADYLVSVYQAKKFVEYRSTDFPPHVNVDENGLGHSIRGEMYHGALDATQGSGDLLIFTADAQPLTSEGEYQLSEVVIEEAKKMGAGLVFSLAAYITGNFVKERRVFGTTTSPEFVPRLVDNGVRVMHEGGITGMNGIVVGMAALRGMVGVSLLGETSGYVVDPAASHAVLQSLASLLKITIDLTSLQERAKEAQQIMGQIQQMTEQETRGKGEGQPGYIG